MPHRHPTRLLQPSLVVKRSIVISHHKTSVSVEAAFWECLHSIAHYRNMTLGQLVDEIDLDRNSGGGHGGNLSSAIRLYVLKYIQREAANGKRATAAIPKQDRA
jgi:predicted DNA-binding ribbon-helix-helix protein